MVVLAFRLLFLAAFVMFLGFSAARKSQSRFTNLKCESYDLEFCKFQNCRLNMRGRGVVATNIHINFLKVPIYQVTINWSLWRRYNSFQPFLYNTTVDFCDLLKHPQRVSFEGLILRAIWPNSNLNHTCPYNHDIIVDNLVFNDAFLQSLPLPQGEYKIQMRFATKKIWKLQIEIFILRVE